MRHSRTLLVNRPQYKYGRPAAPSTIFKPVFNQQLTTTFLRFSFSLPLRGLSSFNYTSTFLFSKYSPLKPNNLHPNKLISPSTCSSPSPLFSSASLPSPLPPSPTSRVSTAFLAARSRPARRPTARAAFPTAHSSKMPALSTVRLASVCLEVLLSVRILSHHYYVLYRDTNAMIQAAALSTA